MSEMPRRCTGCNGTGEGVLVIDGSGQQTRQPCTGCNGSGQQ
ncbi:hypothetical protein [Actinacidiphila glaucinigra]